MLREYKDHKPKLHKTAFVFENAVVIGKVILDADVSVWPGCVLRGDVEDIIIGRGTNIQDGTIVHTNYGMPAIIGSGVTVGHRAVLHGCKIGDNCLIGMGAVVLDGAKIGNECIIGAGALVTENTVIPDGSLVLGIPGKVTRQVSGEEKEKIRRSAAEYIEFASMHKK